MFIINLKYFRDSQDNYILYRNASSTTPDSAIISQDMVVRQVILPKDSTESMEKILDELAMECVERAKQKFKLNSVDSFSSIRVIGNFMDLDETNPVYAQKILEKEKIDSQNTYYRIGIMSECYYPLNLKNFLHSPTIFIKSFFSTLKGSSQN